MLQEVKNDNLNFFKMRDKESTEYSGLNEVQAYALKRTLEGASISRIAKELNVHFTTLSKQLQSLNYISALNHCNDCIDVLTLEECRKELSRLIKSTVNENVKVNAIKTLISMGKTITCDEIANSITRDNLSKEEAKEVLERLGLSTDKNKVGE